MVSSMGSHPSPWHRRSRRRCLQRGAAACGASTHLRAMSATQVLGNRCRNTGLNCAPGLDHVGFGNSALLNRTYPLQQGWICFLSSDSDSKCSELQRPFCLAWLVWNKAVHCTVCRWLSLDLVTEPTVWKPFKDLTQLVAVT